MAGLMQTPICKRPPAFFFCSSASRTSSSSLPRGRDTSTSKKFGQLNLDLGAKSLRRRVVVLEAAEAQSGPRVIASASSTSTAAVDVKEKEKEKEKENGKAEVKEKEKTSSLFADPKWKNGSWDIQQFTKDDKVDWDDVIDAEVRRRKWLEDNPEASSNKEPVVFDTSIIPWWAWMKRFHLPQAELLNGRAAMIGFFMAYVVDSLTGVGLVDQMGSFFGKLFLFIAVTGVLLVRNNEDIANFKQIVKEFNLYDKQWQATWQDEKPEDLGQD